MKTVIRARLVSVARGILVTTLISAPVVIATAQSGKFQQQEQTAAMEGGQRSTLLSDGQWLFTGGTNADGSVSNSLALGNTNSKVNHTTSTLTQARKNHTATTLPNGQILIFGGETDNGQLAQTTEIYDPVSGTIGSLEDSGLILRKGHSATLLTNGLVLVAGGTDVDGKHVEDAQLWNPRTQDVEPLVAPLSQARTDHAAALLANGRGLLWNGRNVQGHLAETGDLYDPVTRVFSAVEWWDTAVLSASNTSFSVEETLPVAQAANVAVDTHIAIRLSHHLQMDGTAAAKITLIGPAGAVAGHVVAAENGRLVFFTPAVDLWPDTTYTAFLKGLQDIHGHQLPLYSLTFTTQRMTDSAASAKNPSVTSTLQKPVSPAAGNSANLMGTALASVPTALVKKTTAATDKKNQNDDEEWEDWIPGPEHRKGNWRLMNSASKNFSKLKLNTDTAPSLSAPAGITAVSGRVLRLNGKPLIGVAVSMDKKSTVTDAHGRFLLKQVSAGNHPLLVDAQNVLIKGRNYGQHLIQVSLAEGQTTTLPQDVFLSRIDPASEITIPSPTTREVVLTHPAMPGLEIRLPKGTILRDRNGKIVNKLSITPVPVDRAPTSIPQGFPLFFTLQPAGAVLENKNLSALRSAKVIYPNYMGLPASQTVDFWNYDAKDKGWYVYAHGKVSDDGKQVEPESGTGEYVIMPFGYNLSNGVAAPEQGPNPDDCKKLTQKGDPVDCSTGLFLHQATDIQVDDVIPISMTRTYRPMDSVCRSFGIGTNDPYSMYLFAPAGSGTPNDLHLILPDGGRVRYVLASGSGGVDSVWEHTSSPSGFNGSIIRINQGEHKFELVFRDQTKWFFENHAPNKYLGMQDRNGNRLTITRNGESGPITRITSPNGRYLNVISETPAFTPSCTRTKSISDNSGRTVTYNYHPNTHYLASVTDADGKTESYAYTNGSMSSVVDRRGNTMVVNEFYTDGRIKKQTLADGAIWQFSYVVDTATNKVQKTTVTDPRGFVEEMSFNSFGYLTRKVMALSQPKQQTWVYDRDSRNRLKSILDPLNRTTAFLYDYAGRVTQVTWLSGTVSAISASYTYDANHGQLRTVKDPLGRTTRLDYDSRGNLISIVNPLGHTIQAMRDAQGLPISITDPLNKSIQIQYAGADLARVVNALNQGTDVLTDGLGRVAGVVDALANRTVYNYDVLDRITSVRDATGGITALQYDPNSNLTRVTDPRNLAAHVYGYNVRNWLQNYTDPLGKAETYTYDGLGNRLTRTDRKSQITRYAYDELNRPTLITFHDNKTLTITWDAGDRPTQIVDSLNGTITRTYDGLDRLTGETTPQGTVSYTYDAAGRRTSMTVTGNTVVTYNYDDADRLTKITRGTEIVQIEYDNASRRTKVTLPNGVTEAYLYDNADRLTRITYAKGTTALGTINYTYDAAGQRITRNSTLDTSGLPAPVASATYDAANRLTKWGAQTLTYDFNGNLTGDGSKTYAWDVRNQLASISGGTSFTYDAFGRRRTKTANSATKTYHYDGMNMTRELSGSTQTAAYLTGLGLDEVYTRNTSAGTVSYLSDALGSTIALTDSAGALQTRYGYDAYGNTTTTGTASTNPFQYTGRENDESGLYEYRARYYSPNLHRFISQDPIGLNGGINTYAYVGGDPVSFIDPMGLFGWADMPPLPSDFVDAAAGFGDALLLGTGDDLRDMANVDGGVDQCSDAYKYGGWGAFAVGGARITYAGLAKGYSIIAPSGAAASAFRANLKSAFRLGIGKNWRPPNLANKTDAGLRQSAGKTNSGMNAYGAGVGAAGAAGATACGCN